MFIVATIVFFALVIGPALTLAAFPENSGQEYIGKHRR